jgi:hypothetical protein
MYKPPMTGNEVLDRVRTIIEYFGHTLECTLPVEAFIGMAVLYESVDPLPAEQAAYFMNMLVRGFNMALQKNLAILS